MDREQGFRPGQKKVLTDRMQRLFCDCGVIRTRIPNPLSLSCSWWLDPHRDVEIEAVWRPDSEWLRNRYYSDSSMDSSIELEVEFDEIINFGQSTSASSTHQNIEERRLHTMTTSAWTYYPVRYDKKLSNIFVAWVVRNPSKCGDFWIYVLYSGFIGLFKWVDKWPRPCVYW